MMRHRCPAGAVDAKRSASRRATAFPVPAWPRGGAAAAVGAASAVSAAASAGPSPSWRAGAVGAASST
eukprot:5917369-Pleurochrysis_carterae.AAC.1